MNEFATCTHCDETITRSDALPVWSHVRPVLAGSTRCNTDLGTKATPHAHAFVEGQCIKFGCTATL